MYSEEKEERRERLLDTYADILDYWEQSHRLEASSVRLNQSREFIREQIENAENQISKYSIQYP